MIRGHGKRWCLYGVAGLLLGILNLVQTIPNCAALNHVSPPSITGNPGGLLSSLSGLPQGVYVWQRNWDPRVNAAVAWSGGRTELTEGIWPLAAETSFRGGAPHTVYVAVDPALRPRRAVWRIGSYPRDMDADGEVVRHLDETLTRLLSGSVDASGSGLDEIQIDFDSATARLSGYAR